MLTKPSTRLVSSLPAEDRAAADRRDEHPRERSVAALLEDARDPELDGEEQEEHRHPGRVERAGVELAALRSRRRRSRSASGSAAASRLLTAGAASAAAAIRAVSMRSANDCAIDSATCAPIGGVDVADHADRRRRPP